MSFEKSPDTLSRALRKLRDHHWIDYDSKQGKRSKYTIRLRLLADVTAPPPHDFRIDEPSNAGPSLAAFAATPTSASPPHDLRAGDPSHAEVTSAAPKWSDAATLRDDSASGGHEFGGAELLRGEGDRDSQGVAPPAERAPAGTLAAGGGPPHIGALPPRGAQRRSRGVDQSALAQPGKTGFDEEAPVRDRARASQGLLGPELLEAFEAYVDERVTAALAVEQQRDRWLTLGQAAERSAAHPTQCGCARRADVSKRAGTAAACMSRPRVWKRSRDWRRWKPIANGPGAAPTARGPATGGLAPVTPTFVRRR